MDKKERETGRKAKFEKTMEEACQIYLEQSGLEEDSQSLRPSPPGKSWKFSTRPGRIVKVYCVS